VLTGTGRITHCDAFGQGTAWKERKLPTKEKETMLKKAFIIFSTTALLAGCGQNESNDRGGTGADTRSTYGSSSSTNTTSSSQNAPITSTESTNTTSGAGSAQAGTNGTGAGTSSSQDTNTQSNSTSPSKP
jgi:hypothetical protein